MMTMSRDDNSDDKESEDNETDDKDSEDDENNKPEDNKDPESGENTDLIDGMRPKFKEALDSYEAFFDEYCEFLEKYQKSPTDLSLIKDYTEYMTQYADTMSKMEALDDGEMNEAEMKYYIEVTGRISKKLLEVSSAK